MHRHWDYGGFVPRTRFLRIKRAKDLCRFLEERGYKRKYVEEQIDPVKKKNHEMKL